MKMDQLSIDIIRCSAGESVQLPYSSEQNERVKMLIREGYIVSVMDDDQPTTDATLKGRMFLESLKAQ
jgi:hypothetical protein